MIELNFKRTKVKDNILSCVFYGKGGKQYRKLVYFKNRQIKLPLYTLFSNTATQLFHNALCIKK